MSKKFSKPHLSRVINGDITTPTGPVSPTKTRLDIALLAKHPEYNRSTLKKYIEAGNVKVNGETVNKANYLLVDTDEIIFHTPAFPEMPKVPVIYEDENVIVLDKPSGLLSVSKGNFNPEPTLESFGLIVHRLDRDTSGVIILAKNAETKSYLQKQFQQRKVYKTYFAIVIGHPKLSKAIIDVPLARNLKKPSTFMPDPQGREAITEYELISQNNYYSALKLKPKTGRTHQLRVHLSHIGTPILGDRIYSKDPKVKQRMLLHAGELEITIPGNKAGQRKVFKSPLPKEFDHAIR